MKNLFLKIFEIAVAKIETIRAIEMMYVRNHSSWIKNDKLYLTFFYFIRSHKIINIDNPKTFNEKLLWLKLYNHKPEYVFMADKLLAKEIVSNKIGEEYVVPCYGSWDKADEIDFDKLPEQFVLKCNHNSGGGMSICKNKDTFDINAAKKILNDNLSQGYFWPGRDKQYRDIKRKILAEKYLDDGRNGELQDYKFWCFGGKPTYMYITNKGKTILENFYDMNFNVVNINHGFARRAPEYEKPKEFDKMKELAETLSEGLPFIRIDFFDIRGKIYFAEYTFFDWGGLRPFEDDWDEKLGELITIPTKK